MLRPFCLVLAVALATCGCEKKDKKEAKAAAKDDGATDGATEAGDLLVAQSVDELKLSGSLAVTVPPSVRGTGAGVQANQTGQIAVSTALTAPLKSREACEVRSRIKDTYATLHDIAREFCYFEIESKNIVFGKRYTDVYKDEETGEETSYGFWVDNSKKHELSIYLCENGRLTDKFTVNAARGGKSRGSFKSFGSDDGLSWAVEGRFDTLTTPGRTKVSTKSIYNDGPDDANFESLVMNLNPRGISVVAASEVGQWIDEETKERMFLSQTGIAKIGVNLGAALTYGYLADSKSTDKFGNRGWFDNAGRVVGRAATPLFADGARLGLDPKMLPKPLDESFTIEPFAEAEWNCGDGEPLHSTATDAQYDQCNKLVDDFDPEDCYDDAAYRDGEEYAVDEKDLTTDDAAAFGYSEEGDDTEK